MSSSASPLLVARLIHAALLAGIVVVSAVLATLPAPSTAAEPAGLLLYALLGAGAVMFTGALLLASRLPVTGAEPDRWWRENLGRVVLVWSMAEGPALLGGVGYYLTRSLQALVVTGVGVFLLALLSPGWLGRR